MINMLYKFYKDLVFLYNNIKKLNKNINLINNLLILFIILIILLLIFIKEELHNVKLIIPHVNLNHHSHLFNQLLFNTAFQQLLKFYLLYLNNVKVN
jgi:hypothetical protein